MFMPQRLRSKLVTSYVLLSLSITLLTLVGARHIEEGAARRASQRADLVARTSEVMFLVSSASEEGFSFALVGDEIEKTKSLSKLGAATSRLRELEAYAALAPDERSFAERAMVALRTQKSAATRLFDGLERSGFDRDRYDAYEVALDDSTDKLTELRAAMRARNVLEREVSAHNSERLIVFVGLAAVLLAIGIGSAFARRLARPVIMLRDAAVAFGAGRTDVPFPPSSRDEIGDLAAAFERMTDDVRRHVASVARGQQLLDDVFASMEEVLLVCDDEGRVVMANQACAAVTGRSRDDLVGMGTTSLFGRPLFEAVERETSRPREFDGIMKTADGEEVAVHATLARLRGHGKTGWVCVAQNMTERHRLEAELRQAQKMEGIGRLAGGVAHDFNNLLTVILSYSELLAEDLSPGDPIREGLGDIKEAGLRAADLTHQLLAFSRKQVLDPKVMDLNEIVSGTEKMLRRVVGESVQLRSLSAPALCKVKVDPGQIVQVMMNLVVNARDAMPSGAR